MTSHHELPKCISSTVAKELDRKEIHSFKKIERERETHTQTDQFNKYISWIKVHSNKKIHSHPNTEADAMDHIGATRTPLGGGGVKRTSTVITG